MKKETTRIITAEITVIGKTEEFRSKEETKKRLESFIKSECDVDDCVVTNIQDFEMDVKDNE